jgi:hypothetical protein
MGGTVFSAGDVATLRKAIIAETVAEFERRGGTKAQLAATCPNPPWVADTRRSDLPADPVERAVGVVGARGRGGAGREDDGEDE